VTTPRWSWLAGLLTTTFVLTAPATATAGSGHGFTAPLAGPLQVVHRFAPPTHPWEPGNRGVDLAAHPGERVYAATAGVVLYAGELAGRGVISIRDGTMRTT
jgi:murein DD-endopeptidase MepM/ murein hydrolase activator NlpD